MTLFAENIGLVVGRTLVDPSRWRVPVLESNFCQDTVMVEPFSEVGMVAQISAIQAVSEPMGRPACGGESLPMHLRDLGMLRDASLFRFVSSTRINIDRPYRHGGARD